MGNKVSVSVFCPSKAVRVVQPDGTMILHSGDALSVADLLLQFPHHYVSQAEPEGRCMLPLEMELKPGKTYFLLPLPRLFTVTSKRITPSHTTFSCCLWFAGGGFPDSSEEEREPFRPERSICARLVRANWCTGLLRTLSSNHLVKPTATAKTTPMTTDMHMMIKSAETAWKEMNELSKTLAWKPELESITEERSPFRQTLRLLLTLE